MKHSNGPVDLIDKPSLEIKIKCSKEVKIPISKKPNLIVVSIAQSYAGLVTRWRDDHCVRTTVIRAAHRDVLSSCIIDTKKIISFSGKFYAEECEKTLEFSGEVHTWKRTNLDEADIKRFIQRREAPRLLIREERQIWGWRKNIYMRMTKEIRVKSCMDNPN